MPTVLAASTTRVPAGTVILWPSIVRFTSGTYSHPADVAFVPQCVVFVLAAEMTERRIDHPAGRVAQAAEAAAVLERVGHLAKVVQLDLRPFVGEDPLVHAHRPVATDAARRALAARLVGVELE